MLLSTPHQLEIASVPVSVGQLDRRAMKVAEQNGEFMIADITFSIPPRPEGEKSYGGFELVYCETMHPMLQTT